MKRPADKQLTKDDEDLEDEVEEVQGEGFRKADDAELAKRPMKGLPKRAMGLSTPSTLFGSSDSSKPPSVFGGFGSGSTSSFTFSTPAPPKAGSAPAPAPAPTSFSFGNTSAAPSSSPFTFPSSSTTTAKSGFPFSSPSANGTSSAPPSTPPVINGSTGAHASELKYYKALRGLNTSLLNTLKDTLEKDPFADVSMALELYKSFRANIQADLDNESKKTDKPPPSTSSSFPSSIFGSKPFESSATKSSTVSFAPPVPPSSFSGFGLNSKTDATKAEEKKDNPPVVSASFSFSTPPAGADKSPPSPFLFGGSAGSGFTPTPFGGGGDGKTSSTNGSPFSFPGSSSSTTDPRSASVFSSVVFGEKTEKTEKSESSSKSSSPFTFGKPPGSAGFGKPVGFTFDASPTPEPDAAPSKPNSGEGALATSSSAPDASKSLSPHAEESRALTPATTEGGDLDETHKVLGTNPNDEEGEGEEHEETTHTSRVKVFKMGEKDGKQAWIDVGVGMVRLKKEKNSNSRRMLSRNSATGKIMLNFKLYHGLKAQRTKQTVGFVGHEEGKKVMYRVKLKDEASAAAFHDALEKEISLL